MKEVVVTGAVRTAIGAFGGTLKTVPAAELARFIMQKAISRDSLQAEWIQKVIFGNCFAPLDVNISRIAAYNAGIPETAPAFSIDGTCGSAMQAIICAVQSVQTGETSLLMAGGVESMSNAPYIMESARWGQRIRDAVASDLLWRGMQDYPIGVGMGLTAENLAVKYAISREEQDEFALQSHQRARKAAEDGKFQAEIAPFAVPLRGREPLLFGIDEHVRHDLTLEQLAKLPPVFKKSGTVTAGNACGMNDASAVVILAARERADELGMIPLARILSYHVAGVDPHIMGIGPVPAIRGALEKAGLGLADIDRFEINEAFAAQYLACERELGLDREKVNVNGGGIALGHPVGATGCRLVVTLIHRLIADDLEFGVASLCAGGGLGFCIIVQRV